MVEELFSLMVEEWSMFNLDTHIHSLVTKSIQ